MHPFLIVAIAVLDEDPSSNHDQALNIRGMCTVLKTRISTLCIHVRSFQTCWADARSHHDYMCVRAYSKLAE